MRKRSKNYNVISLSLLLGLLCSFIFPGLSSYADSCKEKIYEKEKNDLSSQNLLFGSVKLYRKYLSSLFGGNCSLNPSCSNYSLQAFGEDGLLLGFLLTYDRLIHESDEYKFSYKINVDDKIRYYDPLKNNDCWFKKRKDAPIRRLVFILEEPD